MEGFVVRLMMILLIFALSAIVVAGGRPLEMATHPFIKSSVKRKLVDGQSSVQSSGQLRSPVKAPTNVVEIDRHLQTVDVNDPCTALGGEDIFTVNENIFVTPSFWQTCAESLAVDPDNMIAHIQNLNTLTRQYHIFYDLAADPPNSNPATIQTQFGHTYPREFEGIVDLNAELTAIIDEITASQAASLKHFWDINQAFLKYRDGHVIAASPEEQFIDFTTYIMFATPVRFTGSEAAYTITPSYRLDQNSRLQLDLTYTGISYATQQLVLNEQRSVATIDGVSVHDFLLRLGRNEAMPGKTPSLGARVNLYTSENYFWDISDRAAKGFNTNPSQILPDNFVMTYTDGGSDTYTAMVDPFRIGLFPNAGLQAQVVEQGGNAYLVFNRAEAEAFINAPGAQFDAYSRSINAFSPQRRNLEQVKKYREEEQAARELQVTFTNSALDDDVYVVKISSFTNDFDIFSEQWRGVLIDANQGGQTKLIMDLTANGGGFADQVRLLIMVLMPEVGPEWFRRSADINWNNSMQEWLISGVSLRSAISNILASEDINANDVTQGDIDRFEEAMDGMLELCLDARGATGSFQDICEPIRFTSASLDAFIASRSQADYLSFISNLEQIADLYNPWSTVLLGRTEKQIELQQAGPVDVIRGGMPSRRTVKFDFDEVDNWYNQAQSIVNESGGNPFTEYIFLSDGSSASAAAIAPYSTWQLYKNAANTGATRKVSLVGYGGTGTKDDLLLSSVPAARLDVNLEVPLIGTACLRLLINIVPRPSAELNAVIAEYNELVETVAIPPYFADTQPRVPVITYYDNTMGPDAMPFQYVRIPLDFYIPTLYFATGFSGSDLPALYAATREFFDITPDRTTQSPSSSPSARPSLPEGKTFPPSASPVASESPTVGSMSNAHLTRSLSALLVTALSVWFHLIM